MLDFATDGALDQVLETARRFAQEQLAPQQRAFEEAGGLPAALAAEAASIGFDTVDWPDDCGGAAMGALARVRMLEALATGCPAATLALQPLGSVAHALLAFGGPQLLQQEARRLSGTPGARACLVFDQRGALQRSGDTVSGTLAWLPSARIDLLAVLTRDGLLLLDQGVGLAPVQGGGLRGAGASAVRLQAAPVRAHWTDRAAAARALAHARLHVAALLVGQMHAAAEYARRYALERVAFGRPIAHHQALAFLIADMHIAVDAARQLAYEAAWRIDTDGQDTRAAATAFVDAAESALFIGSNAVQILGGAGFMRDVPVEKHLRELRALGLLLGGADAARDDAVAEGDLPPFIQTAALEH